MPVSATPVRPVRLLCVLLLLVGLLTASCRSTQSAYQFKSPTRLVALHPASPDSVASPAASAAASLVPLPAERQVPAHKRHSRPQLKRHLRQAVAQAQTPTKSVGRKSVVQIVRRHGGPQQTTEVGLGTTVLGVLGLVVLPISLLGLLIWGGPVWAVLAVLAALAVLVAYLDPFA